MCCKKDAAAKPGVDRSRLAGAARAAQIERHKIGLLQRKQQIVKALERSAGEKRAEKARKVSGLVSRMLSILGRVQRRPLDAAVSPLRSFPRLE